MNRPFQQRLHKHLAAKAQESWFSRQCAGCSAELNPSSEEEYCGDSCRPDLSESVPAFINSSPATRIASFRSTAAYRALAGAYFEDVDPLEIIEAAGWRCELCGGEIPRFVDRFDPQAATVDHHMPLALGGHHVYSNMRAAHRRCNSSKNAKHPHDLRSVIEGR
ncbi:HNH endonuclease [Streptomyces sp. NPDC006967]|uniref:HNH endonuclease n=1 Tax=Streptomyces sp. NPDC006967 TaxID=3156906 RepID=UPI0033F11F69